jgi:hypothetical protein
VHQLLLSTAAANIPNLATLIWIGGGSVGLVVFVVILVLVLRR